MKALRIVLAVAIVLLLIVVGGYFTTISTMHLGQPRLLHIGHYRVLMETVPSTEAGYWSKPIYAEVEQNGRLVNLSAGHSIRVGRLNFYAVGR